MALRTFLSILLLTVLATLTAHGEVSAGPSTESPYPAPDPEADPGPVDEAGDLTHQVYLPSAVKQFTLRTTISYYMKSVDSQVLYDMGCLQGEKDLNERGREVSLVILDFGRPEYQAGEYGTQLFQNGFVSTGDIAEAVFQFGRGYAACYDGESRIIVGVGTNNCGIDPYCTGSDVTFAHGVAWGEMVDEINERYDAAGLYHIVGARGASDMEVGWNTPENTRTWFDGYDQGSQLWYLLNFGDAAGCPPVGGCGTPEFPNWSQDDLWYISGGGGKAYVVPEIYLHSGLLAKQWAALSKYSHDEHGSRLTFFGPLTQFGACQTRSCHPEEDNTPLQGYLQLKGELDKDPDIAQALPYSSDIRWMWEEPN